MVRRQREREDPAEAEIVLDQIPAHVSERPDLHTATVIGLPTTRPAGRGIDRSRWYWQYRLPRTFPWPQNRKDSTRSLSVVSHRQWNDCRAANGTLREGGAGANSGTIGGDLLTGRSATGAGFARAARFAATALRRRPKQPRRCRCCSLVRFSPSCARLLEIAPRPTPSSSAISPME